VSYDSLRGRPDQADPARAFRLLGLWPGQRISLPAAAALTGEREADLAGTLEALVDASLLESPAPGWFQLHDLLRLFAIERALAEETQEARLEAVTRMLQGHSAVTRMLQWHSIVPAFLEAVTSGKVEAHGIEEPASR
jgi:hypothetical protein